MLNKWETKKGIVALPLMLLISGIVLEMTIATTLVVFYLLQGSAGSRSAADALVIARSGVNDALVKLTRNKDYNGSYTLPMGAQRTVEVTVCNEGHKTTSCSTSGGCTVGTDPGKVEVTTLGTVRGKNRCLQAVYAVNQETGEIRLEESGEIAL